MSAILFCSALLLGLREFCNNFIIYKIYKEELRISPLLCFSSLLLIYIAELCFFIYQGSPATPKQQYLLGVLHTIVVLCQYNITIPAAISILLGLTFLYAIAYNIVYLFATLLFPIQLAEHLVILFNLPFLIPITYITYHYGQKYGPIINNKKNSFLVTLASVVTFFSILAVANLSGFTVIFTPKLVISRSLLFISGIFFMGTVFALLKQITNNRALKEKLDYLEKLQNTEQRYYEGLLASQEEQIAYQKHINTQTSKMLELLDEKKYEELENIFNSLLLSSDKLQHVNLCGHQIIDAVVGYWQLRSWEKDITFQADIRIEQIYINDIDLAVILGNALENAYTAVLNKDVPVREIKVKLSSRSEMLLILISNTFNGEILKKDDQFYSAKRAFAEPGTGLANIQLLVEKYNGYLNITCEANKFNLKLALTNSPSLT